MLMCDSLILINNRKNKWCLFKANFGYVQALLALKDGGIFLIIICKQAEKRYLKHASFLLWMFLPWNFSCYLFYTFSWKAEQSFVI